jgi:hypothetical protein
MLFSEYYKIKKTGEEDWFDSNLKWDTALFLDPILVFYNELAEFNYLQEKIKTFFDIAFKKVALAKGNKNLRLKKDALTMLSFKESYETCLGYTNMGQFGRGMGSDFANKLFHTMVDFIDWGLEEFGEYLSPFELFAEGVGPDRLSDMLSNIIKEDLIVYTQKICNKNKIKMEKFVVQNFSFNEKLGWIHKSVDLPANPFNKKPIILVPKDFLRALSDSRLDFIRYVLRMENDNLRKQASSLITENINKERLIEILRENKDFFKELLKEYIKELKETTSPYDLQNDPALLGEYRELLDKIKRKLPRFNIIETNKDSLMDFVEKIIGQFKKNVESNEGYFLLFNDNGQPRGERAIQTFFWCVAENICKFSVNAPDISPETKTGRGFIDFKFSKGYTNKVLVEVKLAKNDKLYHGLEKQLPTYLESSDIDWGFYLVIKQLAGDNVKAIKLQDKFEKMEQFKKEKIKIKIIDAYPGDKLSASKIK